MKNTNAYGTIIISNGGFKFYPSFFFLDRMLWVKNNEQ